MIPSLILPAARQNPPVGQIPLPNQHASFSSLLDDKEAKAASIPETSLQTNASAQGQGDLADLRNQRHMFTFGELGMFGRHYAQFMPAGKPDTGTLPQATSATLIAPSDEINDAPPPVENRQAISIEKRPYSLHPLEGESSTKNDDSLLASLQRTTSDLPEMSIGSDASEEEPTEEHRAASESVAPAVVLSLANTESFELVSDKEVPSQSEAGASAPAPHTDQKISSPIPINLALLGTSDALVVSIRSPIETDENVTKLHQAVESLAAEFGMDVAELRINGSPVGQTSLPIKGGRNGGRTG